MKLLRDKTFLYWLFFTAIYAVLDMPVIMLAAYAVFFVLYVVKKHRGVTVADMTELILFSVIIPNNYVVILMIDMFAILILIWHRGSGSRMVHDRKALRALIVTSLAYAVFNAIIRSTPTINIAFALLYSGTAFMAYFIFRHLRPDEERMNQLIERLKQTMALQLVCVGLYAVTHAGVILSARDLDWVVGTFGYKQGNIFFIYCAFASFVFINRYRLQRKRENLFYALMAVILLLMTGSIGLTALLALSFFVAIMLNPDVAVKYKAYMAAAALAGAALIVAINPGWVIQDILNMSDLSALTRKVGKLESFRLAFIEAPDKDLSFLLLGSGLAQGSSRASLTCTGLYISGFEGLFSSVYQSSYFTENIYPYLKNYLTGYVGLAYAPLSSILSILNEMGYIGTVLFTGVAACFFRQKKSTALLTCVFALLILLWDNYLEYAKVMFIFFVAYYYTGQWTLGRKRTEGHIEG